ncbi:MAG: hypothetical protein U0324_33020 [Polyangiales bacterium]
MRSIGIRWLGVAALTAYGGAAWAIDPLPVHTATTRLSATNLQPADRLALADAVAQVFVEAGFQDLVPATETRNRLQDVGPVGLSCDVAECAQNVWNPLHARGLVLVRQTRTRTRVTFDIQYLNLRGEVVAHEERDEPITSWAEAIAFARAAATSLALRLPAEYRGPQVIPDAGPTPTPDASVPDAGPAPAPDAQVIIIRDADVPPPVVYVRRWWEVGVGAGLAAGGLALTLTSIVGLANHGSEEPAVNGLVEQRCAFGAPTQTTAQGTTCEGVGVVTPLLLGVGLAAVVGGALLVVDGVRLRPEAAAPVRPRAWQFGASPLARGGGVFTLSGGF